IVNDTFIGKPTRLTQIDTLLYVIDASLDSLVHKFDIKNNKMIEFMHCIREKKGGTVLIIRLQTSSIHSIGRASF
ncbi:MAG: hypothetical protein LBL33_10410, partial [Tannerella sp.]|nr:hypothetical protein [Tannerella sp.]